MVAVPRQYGSAVAIRVVVAEDNAIFREGLARLVERRPDLQLVGTASDSPGLLDLLADHDVDVVVTDIRMPPTHSDEGIQVAAWLRRERPSVGVVVLSQFSEPEYALALLESGSDGRAYLLKDRVPEVDDLMEAIRVVADGGSRIDPVVVEALVAAGRRPRRSALHRLTPRELDVLAQMAQGKSNAAIADALSLSQRAVEKHSNAIFFKLGFSEEPDVNRRVKAVLLHLSESRGG